LLSVHPSIPVFAKATIGQADFEDEITPDFAPAWLRRAQQDERILFLYRSPFATFYFAGKLRRTLRVHGVFVFFFHKILPQYGLFSLPFALSVYESSSKRIEGQKINSKFLNFST
jgi:hypothetical protein